ncbi:BCCT family transporter [Henriciella aquimarina]|uniref:BCCT family transporter n=1 Tax=Henriciella aquimarina TaxID=545261 RepID=UPI001F461C9B|nr:BCCT family transporter [Henriciella aquimarina]
MNEQNEGPDDSGDSMSDIEFESAYDTDYEVGQDNVEVLGLDIHKPVFFLSAGLVILFAIASLVFRDATAGGLEAAKGWVLQTFDWLFAMTPVILAFFCLFLAFSPLGRIRLGGVDARPEFAIHSWLAMLFAAGVGIGFMFYGAAEPLAYYSDWAGTPFNVEPGTPEARKLAFSATLFHWGVSPWVIYAVVGLALGFFAYNKGLPLTIRAAFYPILGERVWGFWGHFIDTLAVISTVFGLATTIGIGATQASSGIGYLLDMPITLGMQIALVLSITGLAVISVLRGMDGGVKLLSNLNMFIALILMIFVFILGPTLTIISGFGTNLLEYIKDAPALSNGFGREDTAWFHDWTIFYWAWWISWSPFVGMFIARISRGRTVREYMTVVVLAPVAISVIWFTTFGETSIQQYEGGVGDLAEGMSTASLTLFEMLHSLPLAWLTSTAAIFLLVVFIVTSADSGALVVDSITSGGKTDAPVPQRVFWACMLGVTASMLLYGGGRDTLDSLQAGTITAALPFTSILLACCISLFLGMRDELRFMKAVEEAEAESSSEAEQSGSGA